MCLGYALEDPEFESQQRHGIFSRLQTVQIGQWIPVAHLEMVKRSLPPSPVVESVWSYTSGPLYVLVT